MREGEPFDEDQVRHRLNRWLARKFGKTRELHEWGYLNIPPRIAVHDLLLFPDGRLADDLRFHVFGDRFGFSHIRSLDSRGVRRVGHSMKTTACLMCVPTDHLRIFPVRSRAV